MKKGLLLFALSLFLITAQGQNEQRTKLWAAIDYSYQYGIKDNGDAYNLSPSDYSLHANRLTGLIGYKINHKISIGFGTGLCSYSEGINTFPVYGDFRYFFKEKPNTFFSFIDVGPTLKISNSYTSGLNVNAGLGYLLPINNHLGINFTIGYNLFKYKENLLIANQDSDEIDNYTYTIKKNNRLRHSLLFGIGFCF